jgi:hypothetical protein
MKVAIISFHKNIKRYPDEWIERYKKSILGQSYKDYQIFELNYGGDDNRIFENSVFTSLDLNDHAQAHNYLVNLCFEEGYDVIMNSNVDDYYPEETLGILISNYDPYYSVISGNYQSFTHYDNIIFTTKFHHLNIDREFQRGHNIISHPSCLYTRSFLKHNEKLLSEEIPKDDFGMWKRMINKGAKFKILSNVLLNYRISDLKTKTNI